MTVKVVCNQWDGLEIVIDRSIPRMCVFLCVCLNYVVSTIWRHIVFTSSDQVTAFIGLTVA